MFADAGSRENTTPRISVEPLNRVLKAGRQASADDLRQHLAPDFAKWWLPDSFEFVDQIPRTSTGKFLKSALRERFCAAHEETREER